MLEALHNETNNNLSQLERSGTKAKYSNPKRFPTTRVSLTDPTVARHFHSC